MRDFNYGILDDVAHRPWPVPAGPWLMTQTWIDLLFAHWTVDPADLRGKVPAAFELDLFDGAAYVGIVPFLMTNVGFRGVPPLPGLSRFAELNVRTYVRAGGKPGVFFFSLDAASALAVFGARALLNLPYYPAQMRVTRDGSSIRYVSTRRTGPADFAGSYRPVGPAATPVRGTLEYFLTERYCLYHVSRRGRPYRLDIHHPPWPLQRAAAEIARNTMAVAAGLVLASQPPLLHVSARQDVVAWGPSRIAGSGGDADP